MLQRCSSRGSPILSRSTRFRLETQLETLSLIVGSASPSALETQSSSGKWSVAQNVAHLARVQEVFVNERIRRMLNEEYPRFGRYRAEEDPGWPAWMSPPYSTALERLHSGRSGLIDLVSGLSSTQMARVGSHPLLGEAPIPLWLEFLLLHEAHHLYVIMRRVHGID
jgi:hypothetical protein